MALSATATPYAMALLDLASDRGDLAPVREQLNSLSALLDASEELRAAFSNPTISIAERKGLVEATATHARMAPVTRNFLLLLADKGRLPILRDITKVFNRLADERTGVVEARVVSSMPLNSLQRARLEQTLAQMTAKSVTVVSEVDPSLIGGLQVHVGGRVYDTSVANRLKGLRDTILSDL